jgi:hypothetical protein
MITRMRMKRRSRVCLSPVGKLKSSAASAAAARRRSASRGKDAAHHGCQHHHHSGDAGCTKKRAQSVPRSAAADAQTQSSPVTLKLHLDRSSSPRRDGDRHTQVGDALSRGRPTGFGLRFEATTRQQRQPSSELQRDQLAYMDALDAHRRAADVRQRRRDAILREREGATASAAVRSRPRDDDRVSPRSPPSPLLPSVPSTPSPARVPSTGQDSLATESDPPPAPRRCPIHRRHQPRTSSHYILVWSSNRERRRSARRHVCRSVAKHGRRISVSWRRTTSDVGSRRERARIGKGSGERSCGMESLKAEAAAREARGTRGD